MMNKLYINGKVIKRPKNELGSGGEAVVYKLDTKTALKLFKNPNHPSLSMDSRAQENARQKLIEIQSKLSRYPSGLPNRIITPTGLVTNDPAGKRIVGYTMPIIHGGEEIIRLAQKDNREKQGLASSKILPYFLDMISTLGRLHSKSIYVGDFNDLNEMIVSQDQVYFIDADSFDIPGFACRAYTKVFVDPLILDYRKDMATFGDSYSADSDWYAFRVMLMQSLLYLHPYFGGLHKPKNRTQKIINNDRPYERVSIYNKDVKTPGLVQAIPYSTLSDELNQDFYDTFELGKRSSFDSKILTNLNLRKCSGCGIEHAARTCPICKVQVYVPTPIAVTNKQITITNIFGTKGILLCTSMESTGLKYIYHHNDRYYRENKQVFMEGPLKSGYRFRIGGQYTFVAKSNELITYYGNQKMLRAIDTYKNLPIYDANEQSLYWLEGGSLKQPGDISDTIRGRVLQNRSLFWVGSQFGIGVNDLGGSLMPYVFSTEKGAINDSVEFPTIGGQIFDTTAVFSENLGWFLVSTQRGSKRFNHCIVVDKYGTVLSHEKAEQGMDSWLSQGIRGFAAMGKYLFVPTDEGLKRIELGSNGQFSIREFEQTKGVVFAGNQLQIGTKGIYIITSNEIKLIQIV